MNREKKSKAERKGKLKKTSVEERRRGYAKEERERRKACGPGAQDEVILLMKSRQL